MKKTLLILAGTIVIFIIAVIATAEYFTSVDGDDTYGYPFTFYTVYGGKMEVPLQPYFNFSTFAFDILLATFAAWLIVTAITFLRKKIKLSRENS